MLLDALNSKGKLTVFVIQPLCIYTKTSNSYSECWDNLTNDNLELDNIDESYGLDLVETGDRIDVYIPRNSRCILKKPSNPNLDCTVEYKNIECDLYFEDEPIDMYFDVVEE